MKKFRHILLFGLALTLSYSVTQAQYAFRVLASSGTSKVAGGADLRVGGSLKSANRVTVSPRSYLSLVHKSGGTVQISKAGTYSISSLEQKLAKTKASVSKRYATYIISELTKGGKENINKNRYKYMNVTGSVKRDLTFNIINLFMASSNNYDNPKVTVKWNPLAMNKSYKVTIENLFNEELATSTVTDTSITIDFSEYKAEDQRFLVRVTPIQRKQAVKSRTCEIGQMSKKVEASFKKAYGSFKKSISGKMNAADKLSEAFIMEDHKLFIDALNSFKEAVKMSGNDEAYITAYHQFLIRHGIGDYAKYVVK
ncbi:hypothetical protein [uncultured Microscilla sp.]|uniref:hypothetical protein n=1 Tax=uncultured Microscilla sp. TaxID=432653 RepID=UPI002621F26B|nr:hypothetical protein [uncultured Microscilla sp.]